MAIHFLNVDGSVKSVEHKGYVLQVNKNVSYRIMSDVWGSADQAIVWDKDSNGPKVVYIRFCDYNWDSPSYAEVDATDDIKAAYTEHLINKETDRRYADAVSAANRIVKGCLVEVVRGRNVKKGTKGKVVVEMLQESGWGYRRSTSKKLGVATSDRMETAYSRSGKRYERHADMIWVWAYNCVRTDAAEVDRATIRKEVAAAFNEKTALAA
jgi:hypothetical protein